MNKTIAVIHSMLLGGCIFFGGLFSAYAGGLIGDLVNNIVPGAGTKLDDAHRDFKNAVPTYKAVEEGGTKIVNEAFVQSGAPALQELIAKSRDDALNSGVSPIPPNIRKNLTGFISDDVINAARYRVQGGGDLTLQVNSIRYGDAQAITLDYVIVFKDQNDALYNPSLWAHELTHVAQYRKWGIKDFSIRYLRNYAAVESEAYEAGSRYLVWTGVQNARESTSAGSKINSTVVNRPIYPFPSGAVSSSCSTAIGTCAVNGSAPVGTPCWCNSPLGAATGSLIPTGGMTNTNISTPTSGFPSGYGMRVRGCYGPNPSPSESEPMCASGTVRPNMCAGFCAPGHPVYAYVCN